ncbi:MAG: peptidase, partial [Segetibacter sp.]|nr:peptidase [Segetibacter sp.]
MQIDIPTLTPILASLNEGKIRQMDPGLQRAVVMRRSGISKRATASTSANEVAVLAKVTNVEEWLKMTEVRSAVIVGSANEQQECIVTGRIPIKRIEYIRALPFVISMKAARRVRPLLSATIPDIQADSSLSNGNSNSGGLGTVIGIIDFGCDFAHQNFLKADNSTRIEKLWVQPGTGGRGAVSYGTLYTANDLNNALTQTDPYNALGYKPEAASHGTHVMDIAAGNGRGTGNRGVAPQAEIIFVELDSSDIPWSGEEAVGKNFGDSVQLLEAMTFIFEQAGDRPCVINASLGTNGGPHDGSTLVEQGIDSLVKQRANRAVVIAASNSFADNIHTAGTIAVGNTHDLSWGVPSGDTTENEMEIWYAGQGRLEVEIINPAGSSLGVVPPDESGTVNDSNGNVVLFVANRLSDPNNHDNMIGLYLNRGNRGTWTIRLKNIGSSIVSFHGWVERDDFGQSFFARNEDNSHTLGSVSCGQYSMSVGSYDAHRGNTPISWFSSAGPTRDGREKPEISAPGHDVVAANALSVTGVTSMSGTSMAAPAVTGSIAVLLG